MESSRIVVCIWLLENQILIHSLTLLTTLLHTTHKHPRFCSVFYFTTTLHHSTQVPRPSENQTITSPIQLINNQL